MIDDLHRAHVGAHVAVLGSSPSALLYAGGYDISIGVNGTSLLGHCFDYYVVGDPIAPDREWFSIKCSRSRIISDIVATRDRQLFPDHLYPALSRHSVFEDADRHLIAGIPQPAYPHHWFQYRPIDYDKVLDYNSFLMYHGTITCSAMQLAWMMGARTIDLFGCAFIESDGYFYKSKVPGRVGEKRVAVMQRCIDIIRSDGVAIKIHGKSALK